MTETVTDADRARQATILAAVFSYNRPAALANCLRSLADMSPGSDVVVYDDNSTAPEIPAVCRHFGWPMERGAGGSGRHGGLYHNMQAAFERAMAGGYDFVLMLQDDQQLLRPLGGAVLDEAMGYFEAFDNVTQVDLRFIQTDPDNFELCEDVRAYRQIDPAYRGYVDVGLFNVSRLKAFGWSFATHSGFLNAGEAKKAAEARAKGMRAVVAFSPCLTHLHDVKVYRNRLRYPQAGTVGRVSRRHAYLTAEDIARIEARPPETAAGRVEYLSFDEPLDALLDRILAAESGATG